MAAWSWRTWPDLLIDFGREAYVAWRLAEGGLLHRDVVYVSGPLSPYWNALLFRSFGVGLDTLFAANAVVATAIAAVWYRLLIRVADRTAAWAAGAVFVALFAFSQYVGIGNYNYIAPYSHELPHGLLLASLGLLCWERILHTGSRPAWLGAGLLLGLVALTKLELLAAALAANGLGFAAWLHRDGTSRTHALRAAAALAGGALLPPALATAALADGLGPAGALRAVAIGALRLFEGDLAALPFYQRGMGSDDVPGNLALALLWSARLGGLLAPAALLALAVPRWRARGAWIPIASFAAMGLALAPFAGGIRWLQAARPLPFFALFALGTCVARLATRRDASDRCILQAMLFAFATVLMAKIFFLGRIYQYGFVLGMPAALLLVAALVSWIPLEIGRRGGDPSVFRAAALGFLTVAIAGHAAIMAPHVAAKSSRLGGRHDAIRVAPGVARTVGRALEAVQARTRPGDSLSVLPEGVMLNFLTRRPTPTPHFSFNPFELHVYGEQAMLDALRASPPRSVLLVHHDTSEHGARFLGRNYGVDLMRWIRTHYATTLGIGDPPLQPGTRFGIALLEPAGPGRPPDLP